MAAEGIDVRGCQFLKKKLITHAAGGLAGATFLGAQHGKVHFRPLQQLGHGARHLHRAAIIRGRTANPVKHIEAGIILDRGHAEAFGPVQAIL